MGDGHFAKMRAAGQMLEGRLRIIEREFTIQHGLDAMGVDRAIHLFKTRARTDCDALHADHWPDHLAQRYRGFIAGDEANHADETAEYRRRQRLRSPFAQYSRRENAPALTSSILAS